MNEKEILMDLSHQIRAEIQEFYTVNAAFILANSFLVSIMFSIKKKPSLINWLIILVFILINFIWYFALLLVNKWVRHWIGKAKKEIKEMKKSGVRVRSIWEEEVYITVFEIKLRRLFYSLPLLFSLLFLLIDYCEFGNLNRLFIYLGVLVVITILGSLSVCKKIQDDREL